ncbi:MAG: OmpA family protein, partial [Pseudomonadota bacterium]
RQARDQLGGLTARVAGLRENVSLPEIDALRETIIDLTRQVQTALAALPTGDGDAARAETAANATAAPSDSTVASEDLSAEVERFASTVTALRQVARIKPVAPQTIVKIERVEPTVTADQRLRQWVSRNAVFFSNGTDVRAPDAVDAALDELAARMKSSDLLVRVVGFTDERGGLSRNNTLALARARRIYDMLRDRGVPRDQLVAVGRAAGRDLSTEVGELSPNRRVEFEIGFNGESALRP